MFAGKKKYCCLFCMMLGIVSCTKKDLPQGTRMSVLPKANIAVETIAASGKNVKVSEPKLNHNWSQNGGNSEHSYGNLDVSFPPEKIWSKKFGKAAGKRDIIISEPIVMDDKVFVLDADAILSSFDLNTGDLLWKTKILSPQSKKSDVSIKSSGIAANASSVFAATGFGEVVALDITSGKELWRYNASTPIRIAPTCSADKLFIQTIDNRLIALNTNNGEEIWNYEILQEDTTLLGGASPALDIAQDILIAAFSNGEIQALKASTGSPLWNNVLVSNKYAASQSAITAIKANPVIVGDKVYAIGNGQTFAAIETRTGERIWELPVSGNYQPIVSGNYIFVISDDNTVYAIDNEDGKIIWQQNLPLSEGNKENLFVLRPLLVNGYILATISDGRVFKISAADGVIVDITDLGDEIFVSPIVANKHLIFSTANAELIIFK